MKSKQKFIILKMISELQKRL